MEAFAIPANTGGMYQEWLAQKLADSPRGTRAALARHMGLEASAITRILTGQRKISANEIPKMAEFFGEEPRLNSWRREWLGREVDRLKATLDQAPKERGYRFGVSVVGEVNAGSFRPIDDRESLTLPQTFVPPDPRFGLEHQIVMIVRGRSIERVARDGDLLVCLKIEATTPQDGDLVIAERIRDQGSLIELTAKRLRIKMDGSSVLLPEYLDDKLNLPLSLSDDREGADEPLVRILAVVLAMYRPLR